MVYSKNMNNAKMKINNKKLVLDTIRYCEAVSRKDLAKKIGMTSAAITNIVGELIADNYLLECGEEESNGGRRAVLLTINPKACYIIGLELSAKQIHCVLTNFKAKILDERHVAIDASAGAEKIINAIANTINEIINNANIAKNQVKGIGLVTPGPCDFEQGIVINPPNLKGWENVPIKRIVEEKTGICVEFEKETAAAAMCEFMFGNSKNSKCLFLCGAYEIGIGGSFLINGRIFHGFFNSAGEIGHMMVDINGAKCACGNYGCLEAMADGRALLNAVKRKLKAEPNLCEITGINDVESLTLTEVLRRADNGEIAFMAEVSKCAMYIGIALSNIIVSFSPDTIVLAGDIPNNSNLFVQEVKRYIYNRKYPKNNNNINIYRSKYTVNIDALGGVAMVINKAI